VPKALGSESLSGRNVRFASQWDNRVFLKRTSHRFASHRRVSHRRVPLGRVPYGREIIRLSKSWYTYKLRELDEYSAVVYPAYRLFTGLDRHFWLTHISPGPSTTAELSLSQISHLTMGLSMGLDKPTTGQAFLVGPSKPRPVDLWRTLGIIQQLKND
jgi:hypothetical protein